MNIAFCISGHARTYKHLHQNYLDFHSHISKYGNIDVFAALWDTQNTFHSWSAAHGLLDGRTCGEYLNEDEIKKHFHASKVVLFPYSFYDSPWSPLCCHKLTSVPYSWDARGISPNGIVHSAKMLFLIFQANMLKSYSEQFTTYDLVFRLRPDMILNKEVYTRIDFNNLDFNNLYRFNNDDRFAFGSSQIMDKYSSSILQIAHAYNNNIFGDPESVQQTCIEMCVHKDQLKTIEDFGPLLGDNMQIRVQKNDTGIQK